MPDLDLTAAIEKLALLMTGRLDTPLEHRTWEDLGPHAHAAYREEATEVVGLVAPIIERAVREQAALELVAWADGLDHAGSSALRRLRRHIHMCVQRIGPKMTDAEMVQALQRGDFAVCHLDDAGRAIPPAGSERGE